MLSNLILSNLISAYLVSVQPNVILSCFIDLYLIPLYLLFILSSSPPARWGLLDFMSDARLLRLVVLPSSSFLPHRTLSASSWSQWASPDLICQLLIAMVLAGLQPARVWALRSSPDFNQRESERCGPRRTSNRQGSERCGPRRTLNQP